MSAARDTMGDRPAAEEKKLGRLIGEYELRGTRRGKRAPAKRSAVAKKAAKKRASR